MLAINEMNSNKKEVKTNDATIEYVKKCLYLERRYSLTPQDKEIKTAVGNA